MEHFKGHKCDSDAVADCLKCNATFLARESLHMLRTLAEIDGMNTPDQERKSPASDGLI
jgi:hypothetical protein